MSKKEADTIHRQWAHLRFTVVGSLLYAPPEPGQLKARLHPLTQQSYRHPVTGMPVRFGLSTIERWYYRCRRADNPIDTLSPKRRTDARQQRALSTPIKELIRKQYQAHKGWSYQLHVDNLQVQVEESPALGSMPSYGTLRRFMKATGLIKKRRLKKAMTPGLQAAEKRLETREVRSYEMDHIHALWHLDYHHGSRPVITQDGQWVIPKLLVVMDDRSRVVCHAQWYLDETVESLVHGFCQAIQKRALPRALMTDNGAAMVADECTQGLERLSIVHNLTLPYSPYQNAKQEFFWTHIEGRLMPMLEGEPELTLALLNQATQAWVEREYPHREHSEIQCTPIHRYLHDNTDVGRESPTSEALRRAFRVQIKRRQRRSDGTISLDGQRFEIPSRFQHLEEIHLRYARWDLSFVERVDPHDGTSICRILPLDKSANASGLRRVITATGAGDDAPPSSGIAPLLRKLMADYSADGLPPAYIPKDDLNHGRNSLNNQSTHQSTHQEEKI